MAQLPQVWPRGYMVDMDLGPEARYKDVRCVKYERSASKVNRVLYIPYYYLFFDEGKLMEGSGRCSGNFWQVQ